MVIVRRRSDGKYYNGARSNAGYQSGMWVDDPNECLPYKNKRGAFGALGRACYVRVMVEGSRYPRYEFRPELWDELFEIIPVTISIQEQS